MRSLPPQIALMASAGILCAGVAWAGNLFMSQPEYKGTDPRQIRELAERLEAVSAEAAPLTAPAGRPARRTPAAHVDQPRASSQAGLARSVAANSSQRPQRAPVPSPSPAPTPAAPEDPVKNLVLFGLTREDETDQAWLVDLTNQQREVVPVGGTAFGFTVRKIGADAVTLARGSDEYQLRLGEKQLATSYAAASSDGGTGEEGGFNPFGGGERGERGRDGFRGFPGGGSPFGGGDFASRMAAFRSRFGSSGGSWGDRGSDRGSSYRSSSYSSSSDRGRDDDRGRDSSRYSSSRYSGSRYGSSYGGFGGFGGFGGYGGSSRSSSQFTSAGATSTSNPQTARRNGARLSSGSQAQEAPQPITNPQTTRRSGNTSGLTFGQDTNSRGRNSSSSSRSLSYGR